MNVKKGDFITVLEWVGGRDNSYKGDCLEVKAVDYPFIRVLRHSGYNHSYDNITLNLDRLKLKRLSKEFILSVIPDYKGRLPSDARANDFDDKLLVTWVAVCVCVIFYLL